MMCDNDRGRRESLLPAHHPIRESSREESPCGPRLKIQGEARIDGHDQSTETREPPASC